jgi:hypothetical protein
MRHKSSSTKAALDNFYGVIHAADNNRFSIDNFGNTGDFGNSY